MHSPIACPSCATPMRVESFERKLGGTVTLDICVDCKHIWLDEFESAQLAPDGLIKLFKLINEHQNSMAHPTGERVNCPRCRTALLLTFDMQRSNRFRYLRCGGGHGRLTSFYQFLREKNFVRDLTRVEITQLKAEIKQVDRKSVV